VVARLDRHRDAGSAPPVETWPDREHDAVLRRRLVGTGRHDEARAADAIRLELLDHHLIEQRAKLVAHRS
jgi:hypothetical protein